MRKELLISILLTGYLGVAGQTKPSATGSPSPAPQTPVQGRPLASFDLSDYGVSFAPDPRLIVVMAALDAAGFDPTPLGREPSVFRARVRQDQAGLDVDLRQRLRGFFEHNKLPAAATPAEQAARYVSLAYALGPPPTFEAADRNEDLPGGVLDVLDFAPLVREFYRRSGIDERLVSYTRAYQSEGDRLRQPTAEMVRSLISYLHTRPILITNERVLVRAPAAKKKNGLRTYSLREHERNFFIVPDLLATPGTINLRVIADDYNAILPEGTDPTSSELRRAYLRFVLDPLVLRFNKEIAERRDPVKQLLKERETAGASVTPDVFLAVSRSLVAAADSRYSELLKLQMIAINARSRLSKAKDDAARAAIGKEAQTAISGVEDDTIAQLADEYERGSVLAFYFADQLKGIETSGFDIANFLPDMIASFDPVREAKRPSEYANARARSMAARQARLARRSEPEPTVYSGAEAAKAAALVKSLAEIETVLRQKDYTGAEARLRELIKDYPREPRVFYAVAQTASIAAADATDENVQAQRLNNALSNYRLAVAAATPETDRALLSRAHEAMGRIYAFMEKRDDAANEFDEAIKIGPVEGGAHQQALEGKQKLNPPK